MNKILIAIILFLSLLIPIEVNGGVLISDEIEQNGNYYDCHDVFHSPSPLKIKLVEDVHCKDWSVSVLTTDGIFTKVSGINKYDGFCIVDPYQIEKYIWKEAERHHDMILNRDFFKIKIDVVDEHGETENIIIKWALVPSNPIIYNVSFSYIFNWDDNDIYPNGIFSFCINTIDATGCFVNISESFLYEEPDFYPWGLRYDASDNPDINVSYEADWGEYICVEAYNYFGGALSDAICTTSYITDPEILKRIKDLQNADINEIQGVRQDSFITLNHNDIVFNEIADIVYLYNVNGQLIDSWKNRDHIDISQYPNDIYIVTAIHNAKSHQIKIMKK